MPKKTRPSPELMTKLHAAANAARERVSGYTPEQRADLEARARERSKATPPAVSESRHTNFDHESFCNICSREATNCCCNGIQTWAYSCYPGEHCLVMSHPGNKGQQWYKRDDVDKAYASAPETAAERDRLREEVASEQRMNQLNGEEILGLKSKVDSLRGDVVHLRNKHDSVLADWNARASEIDRLKLQVAELIDALNGVIPHVNQSHPRARREVGFAFDSISKCTAK